MLVQNFPKKSVGEGKINKISDKNGTLNIRSRISAYQLVLMPRREILTESLVKHYHFKHLHRGAQATMCKIGETIWIPRLK